MAKQYPDNLSRDAAMALAARMSYGKWKAMQNPVKIEPKPNMIKVETQKCLWCGVEFVSTDSKTKYCSRRCRKLRDNAYMVQKYREKVTQTTDDP